MAVAVDLALLAPTALGVGLGASGQGCGCLDGVDHGLAPARWRQGQEPLPAPLGELGEADRWDRLLLLAVP